MSAPTEFADLPAEQAALLFRNFVACSFAAGERLLEPGVSDRSYFVVSGLVSLQFGSNSVGVGLVGPGGFLNIGAVLGTNEVAHSAIALTPCVANAIASETLRSLSAASAVLRLSLARSVQARTVAAMQAAACHLLHPLEQRLASWLLSATELTGGSEIAITHRRLAELLGVHRPTVTLALQMLEGRRAIRARRNRIVVGDRSVLQASACGCLARRGELATRRAPDPIVQAAVPAVSATLPN